MSGPGSEQYEGSTSSHAPVSVTGAVTERGDTGANMVTRRVKTALGENWSGKNVQFDT